MANVYDVAVDTEPPQHLDLVKDKGLTVVWSDGTETFFPIEFLRAKSPSAEMQQLREEMARNPLTVLPASMAESSGPLRAVSAEMVGHYALRIEFSDGHRTGLFSWDYLRQIAGECPAGDGQSV